MDCLELKGRRERPAYLVTTGGLVPGDRRVRGGQRVKRERQGLS